MGLAALCLCGILLAFSDLPWTTADAAERAPRWRRGAGPCTVMLRPAGPCGQGPDEGTCPYHISLPPLTVYLPKQLRELEKLVGEVQRLKDKVDQLRKICADCAGGENERESGPKDRESRKEKEGKENHDHTVESDQKEKNSHPGKEPDAEGSRERERTGEAEGNDSDGSRVSEEKERKRLKNEREKIKATKKEKEKNKKEEGKGDVNNPRGTEVTHEEDVLWETEVQSGGERERERLGDKAREKANGRNEGRWGETVTEAAKDSPGGAPQNREHQAENGKGNKTSGNGREENDHQLWQDKTETGLGNERTKITEDYERTNTEKEQNSRNREEKREMEINTEMDNKGIKPSESSGKAGKEFIMRNRDEESGTGEEIKTEREKPVQSIQRDSDGEFSSNGPSEMADIVSPSPGLPTLSPFPRPDNSEGLSEPRILTSPPPFFFSSSSGHGSPILMTTTSGTSTTAVSSSASVSSARATSDLRTYADETTHLSLPRPGDANSDTSLDGKRATSNPDPEIITSETVLHTQTERLSQKTSSTTAHFSPLQPSQKWSISRKRTVTHGIQTQGYSEKTPSPLFKSAFTTTGRPTTTTVTSWLLTSLDKKKTRPRTWIRTTTARPRPETVSHSSNDLSAAAKTTTTTTTPSHSSQITASSGDKNLNPWTNSMKIHSTVNPTNLENGYIATTTTDQEYLQNETSNQQPIPPHRTVKKPNSDLRPKPEQIRITQHPNPEKDSIPNQKLKPGRNLLYPPKNTTKDQRLKPDQKSKTNQNSKSYKKTKSSHDSIPDQKLESRTDYKPNLKPKPDQKPLTKIKSNTGQDPSLESLKPDPQPNPRNNIPEKPKYRQKIPNQKKYPDPKYVPDPQRKPEQNKINDTKPVEILTFNRTHTHIDSPTGLKTVQGVRTKLNQSLAPDQEPKYDQKNKTVKPGKIPQPKPTSIPNQSPQPVSNKTRKLKLPVRPWPPTKSKPNQKTSPFIKPRHPVKPKSSPTTYITTTFDYSSNSKITSHSTQTFQAKTPATSSPVKEIIEHNLSQEHMEVSTAIQKTSTSVSTSTPFLKTSLLPLLHTVLSSFTTSPNSRIKSDPRPKTPTQTNKSPDTSTHPGNIPITSQGSTAPSRLNSPVSNDNSDLRAEVLLNQWETASRQTEKDNIMTLSSSQYPTAIPHMVSTHKTKFKSPTAPATFIPDHSTSSPIPESTTPTARELRVKINQVAAFLNNGMGPYDAPQDIHLKGDPDVVNQGVNKANSTDSQLPPQISSKVTMPRDCSDHMTRGATVSGIYQATPDPRNRTFPVLCDMDLHDGGWTLIQQRLDGSVSFNRTWMEYRAGFGELNRGEFWLGNDKIHLLTRARDMVLRVELEDFMGVREFAEYGQFSVASERQRYRLTVGSYSGSAGDALRFSKRYDHNNRAFTTPDKDHDRYPSGNCGAYYSSGWWFDACLAANLNGKYYVGTYKGIRDGIYWGTWHNILEEYYPTSERQSFKTVKMMIRPKGFVP